MINVWNTSLPLLQCRRSCQLHYIIFNVWSPSLPLLQCQCSCQYLCSSRLQLSFCVGVEGIVCRAIFVSNPTTVLSLGLWPFSTLRLGVEFSAAWTRVLVKILGFRLNLLLIPSTRLFKCYPRYDLCTLYTGLTKEQNLRLFFKQVRISPEIDWYHYQSANAAPTCIVRHLIKTDQFSRSVTSEPTDFH